MDGVNVIAAELRKSKRGEIMRVLQEALRLCGHCTCASVDSVEIISKETCAKACNGKANKGRLECVAKVHKDRPQNKNGYTYEMGAIPKTLRQQ